MAGELSPVNSSGDLPAQSELRASHTDRDRVVELLRVAAGDGRLTPDELDERLGAALTARTYSELAVLTTDLPAVPAAEGAAVPVPEARQLVRIECGSGSAKRDGHWVVPERIEVRVSSGSVKLDLTRAVISSPTLQVDADVRSGSLVLVTRPGIVVDTDDVAVRSGSVGVKAPRGAGVPAVLRVHVTGQVGSGSLKARPPRRTFWQWLLRRPVSYD
ncbi:MAG TPA: DUF1707 domain-containing protein [Streptosporangiaceae bacterium]|jgi:hypothetical protein|nr:DUF1707 domain-containing protein [Streptosporangiaceae bacterium]